MNPKDLLKSLFLETLDGFSPAAVTREALMLKGEMLHIREQDYDLTEQPVYLLAVGKASVPMMNAAMEVLGKYVSNSLAITAYQEEAGSCRADEVMVGSHPVPDERSLAAGGKAVDFIQSVPEGALVITLISGGTSSLLCRPAEGISIGELSATFELLNNSGAKIHEMNTVRKHCSRIKGGQLLSWLNPETSLVDLVISDVPGDDISLVGSGPTTCDRSTFQDTYHILLEHELWNSIPASVQMHIEKGIDGEVPETVKPGEDPVADHHSLIISSAARLAQGIAERAKDQQLEVTVTGEPYNADVAEVAGQISRRVLRKAEADNNAPQLFIFYGESTVKVTGDGKGGRNQELALRGALKIAGYENITWLSAGTDGIDGPTDAAGAIVDGITIEEAQSQGIDPQTYLKNNDSYNFHRRMGTLLKTGPTGNNLMDVILVLVEK